MPRIVFPHGALAEQGLETHLAGCGQGPGSLPVVGIGGVWGGGAGTILSGGAALSWPGGHVVHHALFLLTGGGGN